MALLDAATYKLPDAEVLYLITPEAAKQTDQRGETPLHFARYTSSVAVVEALVRAHPKAAETTNIGGRTPLHFAATNNSSVAVVEALVRAHPKAAEATDINGETPLHLAARYNSSVAVVEALVRAHPKAAEATDSNGDTPLHFAARYSSSVAVVEALVRAHPKAAEATDEDGDTPADFAQKLNGNAAVKAFFASGQHLAIKAEAEANAKVTSASTPPSSSIDRLDSVAKDKYSTQGNRMEAPADQYQGLTNEEDFKQVHQAKVVNIISTPWITNPHGAAKAAATKVYHDNPAAGIYTFNPNTGLTAAAAAHNLNQEQQGQKWLKLWTDVLKKTKQTRGTCFVMAKGSGKHDHVLEGNAQSGEVQVAELADVDIQYVYY